jgi:hypothetical protein
MGLGCQVAQSGIPRKGVARTMYGLLGGRGDQSYSFLRGALRERPREPGQEPKGMRVSKCLLLGRSSSVWI